MEVSPLIIVGFVLLFAAMWLGIAWVLSHLGWARFVDERRDAPKPPPDARRFGHQSMAVSDRLFGAVSYSRCMNGWLHATGLFLRPSAIFAMFHPTLHFRWDEIEAVEPGRWFFVMRYKAHIRGHSRPLVFYGRLGRAIMQEWSARKGERTGMTRA